MFKKCDFLKVVKIPYPKNRFLVNLRSFFSTYKIFGARGWLYPVSTFKEEYLHEIVSSLVSKKVIQFSAKVLILATFDDLGPPSKSIFSTYRQKFKKSLVTFVGEFVKNKVLKFELSIFKKVRGVAALQVDTFQSPWF